MLVTRYNPLNDIRRSFDIFNSIVNGVDTNRDESSLVAFVPAVNTREDEYAYRIEIDLPGIKKKDIDIDVEDNVLKISGDRKVKKEIKDEEYYKVESNYGKFSRSFTLPERVDIENINAESKDGVLEVVVPKIKEEEKKSKKIKVK